MLQLPLSVSNSSVMNFFLGDEKVREERKQKHEMMKEQTELKQKFYRLMFEEGHENKYHHTFYLQLFDKEVYGYPARIHLAEGLSFDQLKKSIMLIQENLKCIWVMNTEQFKDYADVKIILNPLDENIPFENPKVKPHEMYLGIDFSKRILKNDMNKYQMVLLGGAIGKGKTRFLNLVLISYILNCTPSQVKIYLSDIAKNEFIAFSNVKHIRYYAETLEKLFEMMLLIEHEIENRKAKISKLREQGLATNIEEYNKVSKIQMGYAYVIIDEFSLVLPDKSDDKMEKEIKEYIIAVLKKVSKIGRSLGIFSILCTQKVTKDEIPPILKNMSAVRISFGANDMISSEVIMGNHSAVGLKRRYAVYSQNGGEKYDYLYVPYIETKEMSKMLQPFIDKDFRKLMIEEEEAIKSQKRKKENESKQEQKQQKGNKRSKKNKQQYEIIDTTKINDDKPIVGKPLKTGTDDDGYEVY